MIAFKIVQMLALLKMPGDIKHRGSENYSSVIVEEVTTEAAFNNMCNNNTSTNDQGILVVCRSQ